VLSSFWNWLNRPDVRERLPNGKLVLREPWPVSSTLLLLDKLPLWLQRLLQLLLFLFVIAALGVLAYSELKPS
jgi:hypothetical protein